jgi:hypothetical protein
VRRKDVLLTPHSLRRTLITWRRVVRSQHPGAFDIDDRAIGVTIPATAVSHAQRPFNPDDVCVSELLPGEAMNLAEVIIVRADNDETTEYVSTPDTRSCLGSPNCPPSVESK